MCNKIMVHLQGRVEFPTGGNSPRPTLPWLIRCNSETDSTVWYAEDETFLFTHPDVINKVLPFCGEAFFRGRVV